MSSQLSNRCFLSNLFILIVTVNYVSATFCSNDNNCLANQLCRNNSCSRGPTGTGKRCDHTIQCPRSSWCLNNECTCLSTGDCLINEFCSIGKCKIKSACSTSWDCSDGQRCICGNCQYPILFGKCNTTLDCPESQECDGRECTDPANIGRIVFLLAGSLIAAAIFFAYINPTYSSYDPPHRPTVMVVRSRPIVPSREKNNGQFSYSKM